MTKILRNAFAVVLVLTVLQSCSSSSQPNVTLKGSDHPGSTSSLIKFADSKGTINALELKLNIYKFAASLSTDCSSPIIIFTNAAGEEHDITTDPSFGSGPLNPDTYPCVMIEMSKVIKTKPATTCGSNTGQEFSDVICNDGQQSKLIDGTAVTCADSRADEHITIYMVTTSAGTGGDRALLPPLSTTDTTSGVILTNPFIVSGDTTGTLSVSLVNFLSTDGVQCGTNPPPFTFN